jgi:hypothetical protein
MNRHVMLLRVVVVAPSHFDREFKRDFPLSLTTASGHLVVERNRRRSSTSFTTGLALYFDACLRYTQAPSTACRSLFNAQHLELQFPFRNVWGGPQQPRDWRLVRKLVRTLIKCDVLQAIMSRCCATLLGARPYFITETVSCLTVACRGIIKTVGPSELPPSPFVIKTEHVISPISQGV